MNAWYNDVDFQGVSGAQALYPDQHGEGKIS